MVSKIWYLCLQRARLKTRTKRFFRLIPVLPRKNGFSQAFLGTAFGDLDTIQVQYLQYSTDLAITWYNIISIDTKGIKVQYQVLKYIRYYMPEIKRVLTDPDLVVHCRSKFSTSTLEFLGTAMYIPWHFKIIGEQVSVPVLKYPGARGSTDQLRTMVCTQHDGMPWCTHSNMVIGMYTRVLEYAGGPLCGVRSAIFKPQLLERHLYCCAHAARSSLQ